MKQLNYTTNFIDTVSTISNINPQLLICKNANTKTLSLATNTRDLKVYCTLTAPEENFNFVGTKFALLNFTKFKQYFLSCQIDKTKLPILETINDELNEPVTLVIKQPLINAEIKHTLASIDCMFKPALYNAEQDKFMSIGVTEATAKFEISNEQMSNLQKMISTIGATNVQYSINQGVCTITLFNPKTADVFSQCYPVTTIDESVKFDITISATGFNLLPNSKYNVVIDKEGLIHFAEMREDDIDVNFYLAAEF